MQRKKSRFFNKKFKKILGGMQSEMDKMTVKYC